MVNRARRLSRMIALMICDLIILYLSYYLSLALRFGGEIPLEFQALIQGHAGIMIVISLGVFYFSHLYSSVWKYASIRELMNVIVGVVIANALVMTYYFMVQIEVPRSILLIAIMIQILGIGGLRLSYRFTRRVYHRGIHVFREDKRVMIYGGGDAGEMVMKEYMNKPDMNARVVVVIDDDPLKWGGRIHNVPIFGGKAKLEEAVEKFHVDEVIVAVPSVGKKERSQILKALEPLRLPIKILPGVYELIDGKATVSQLRSVEIEDLLGRDVVKLDTASIREFITGKRVLVTGGGGSIGSEICRQLARFQPEVLYILDIYENNAYDLQQELRRKYPDLDFHVEIASIRDRARMKEVFWTYRPQVVFHAAAHKHVPLMEDSPKEAVKNNVFGSFNVMKMADKYHVERFVQISTDKAVNPTNVMGTTKRICEMLIQGMNRISRTEFVAVRFGNVLGSNGSVIPLFKKQIEEGGPVTVTHQEMKRYFMTIPEAAQLVLQSGAIAQGGEIFVLDMGEQIKIIDLARELIRLSGFKPDDEIPISITGLRPGEKLYEEILINYDDMKTTRHKKIFIEKPAAFDISQIEDQLSDLELSLSAMDKRQLIAWLQDFVPTYYPNPEGLLEKAVIKE
jgi:FlaA1/EpsC-like NDP-sugar epimerase